MLNFKDVLKANIRYIYIIIISILIGFTIAYSVSNTSQSFLAKNTLLVEKNATVGENEFITQAYADTVIKEMEMTIKHNDFAKQMIVEIAKTDKGFADTLTEGFIQSNMKVLYKEGTMFFDISYSSPNMKQAQTVADTARELAIKTYNQKEGTKAKLTPVYTTEIFVVNKSNVKQIMLGCVIGFIIGELLVIAFIYLNPYVEERELLKKLSGIDVIATLEKEKVKK